MTYKYFISYNYGNGFGCTESVIDYKIESMEDIKRIRKEIEDDLKKNGMSGTVVILYWREF